MKNIILKTVILLLVVGIFSILFPWKWVNWGTITTEPSNVVVVTGYADESSVNQTATFNVGVTVNNSDKQKAVEMVNTEITSIIQKVKDFGIPEKDIKTQSMSIYQNQESYTDSMGSYRTRPGEWFASNTIDIKFSFENKDDVTKLADMLASTGATNVWGPNFSVDNEKSMEAQKSLLDAAIKDAREKAEIIAQSSGRKLGKVVSVNESSSYNPTMPMYDRAMGGGGGGYVEPGTSNITQSVTVVFELK